MFSALTTSPSSPSTLSSSSPATESTTTLDPQTTPVNISTTTGAPQNITKPNTPLPPPQNHTTPEPDEPVTPGKFFKNSFMLFLRFALLRLLVHGAFYSLMLACSFA